MKKIAILLLCLAATISVSAQRTRIVKAKGPVVTKERSVGEFTGIKVSTGIDVYLTQGSNTSLSVEAAENLHEYIKTEVRDGILHVFKKVRFVDSKVHKAHVTMNQIESLGTSSAGDIFGENTIKVGELKLSASSSGDIKVDVDADKIFVDCSSSGDIVLSGKADYLKASASSSGDLKAGELKVKEAKVRSSSSADITVNVSETLIASASSSGDIRYYGDPKLEKHVSSSGSVKRK